MAKKGNGRRFILAIIGTSMGLVLTAGGMLWAMSAQNTRFETFCREVEIIKPKVDMNNNRITALEVRQTEIYNGVKQINTKLDNLPLWITPPKN